MVQIFAKSYEVIGDKCYVDGVLQATTDSCDGFFGAALAIVALIFIPLILLGLVFFAFWVWMLIHAIQNEDIKDRTIWLVTLLASLPLGFIWLSAPIYYFAVKRPYDKTKTLQHTTATDKPKA